MTSHLFRIALLAVCGAASLCAQDSAPNPTDSAPKPAEPAPAAASPGVSPEVSKDAFIIGPEDILSINVLHERDLTGPQEVRADGMISLQLVGEIKASGRTPLQLAEDIRAKLLATIRNPEVNVQILKVNSRKYTIQGEVNRPGTYTFSTPVTVLQALVSGMGFRDFANVKRIYVLRDGKRIPFNYKNVSHGKHTEQNIVVQNGDQIFVP